MTATAPSAIQPGQEEISAADLHALIQQPNNLFILDVRTADEFEAWRIVGRHTPPTVNIPYTDFIEDQDAVIGNVPADRPVVIVCAIGAASNLVAAVLDEHGRHGVELIRGMEAWGNYYARRTIASTDSYAIVQIDRPARGCLSYVLIAGGQAAVIDPARHINQYLNLFVERGVRLSLILDTHAHADHISGGPALADAAGAPYYLHPYDAIHPFDMLPAQLSYVMLSDGNTFTLGDLTIETIHVPGHTLGQVNYLTTASDGESFLFTGDNLFIESFGRPDLGGQGRRWAPIVYETIFERIKGRVADEVWMLPGHYSRPDEANAAGAFVKRMGAVWRENRDLQYNDRDVFIAYVLSHLPRLPDEYVEIKRVNIGLSRPTDKHAFELELGKNICALSSAY
ncbi:MAG: MBL fold metallo-hydrolase [Anaerolineae bacterium]|nr:MBL fold metallo-hydrolase [Anaerolineae bacterium]